MKVQSTTNLPSPPPRISWLYDLAGLTLISLVFFALFLGSSPLRLPDEGRYAEVAREMFAQWNFMTPTLNGAVFFDKPPLYYWLSALAMSAGGVNEWMARIAPALFGLIGILGTYVTGRLIDNRRTGWIAAGVLATTPLYFLMSHFANCDLIVAVCLSLSLFSFLVVHARPDLSIRGWVMLSAYVWCALAILAKGLIGIVLPAAIIGGFILLFNRWSFIKNMHLIVGLVIVLAIVLPWFVIVSNANPDFLHYFFYVQHYQRFISLNFNDKEPFWFYIPIVLVGIWPWTLWLKPAFRQRLSLGDREKRIRGFLLIWVAITLVFFSIPASKTIGYIIPIFPPLALIIARYISANPPGLSQRFPMLLNLIILFLAGLALIIAPHIQLPNILTKLPISQILSTRLGWGLLTLSLLAIYAWCCGARFYIVLIITQAILLVTIMAIAYLGGASSTKGIVAWTKTHHIPPGNIYVFNQYPFDLSFYLQKPIHVVIPNWQDPTLASQDNWQGEFAYALQQTSQVNPRFINQPTFIKHWQSKTPVYVVITAKQIGALQAITGEKSITTLSVNGKWHLVTNNIQTRTIQAQNSKVLNPQVQQNAQVQNPQVLSPQAQQRAQAQNPQTLSPQAHQSAQVQNPQTLSPQIQQSAQAKNPQVLSPQAQQNAQVQNPQTLSPQIQQDAQTQDGPPVLNPQPQTAEV